MSLRFSYKLFRTQHGVLSLRGRWVRPRPVFRVSLVGPVRTWVAEALLDTGSDDTVFPEWIAAKIGLDLSRAPTGEASGVGLAPAVLRYAELNLRLTDGREFREWPAWVGFTTAKLKQPLLGFAGCLQFFAAFFQGDREEVELTVNGSYPGN